MFQAFSCALAGHFHEPKWRKTHDVGLRAIAVQRTLQGREDLAPMGFVVHIDEVDDDDAAEIAQTKLARNRYRGLEVGTEDRFLEIAVTDIRSRVDIDSGHRLRLVDHQMAAGLQRHLAIERLADLVLDPVKIEDRTRTLIKLNASRRVGHEGRRERDHVSMLPWRIHENAIYSAGKLVAQHTQG